MAALDLQVEQESHVSMPERVETLGVTGVYRSFP